MNSMKNLIILCVLALIAGSAFTGCAAHEKKSGCCGGKTCSQ